MSDERLRLDGMRERGLTATTPPPVASTSGTVAPMPRARLEGPRRPRHSGVDRLLAALLVPSLGLAVHASSFALTACLPREGVGVAPLAVPHGLLWSCWAGAPLPGLLLAPVLVRWLLGTRARGRGDLLLARWPYPPWLAAALAMLAAVLLPTDDGLSRGFSEWRWAPLRSLGAPWLTLAALPLADAFALVRGRLEDGRLTVRRVWGGMTTAAVRHTGPGTLLADRRYWLTGRCPSVEGVPEGRPSAARLGLGAMGAMLAGAVPFVVWTGWGFHEPNAGETWGHGAAALAVGAGLLPVFVRAAWEPLLGARCALSLGPAELLGAVGSAGLTLWILTGTLGQAMVGLAFWYAPDLPPKALLALAVAFSLFVNSLLVLGHVVPGVLFAVLAAAGVALPFAARTVRLTERGLLVTPPLGRGVEHPLEGATVLSAGAKLRLRLADGRTLALGPEAGDLLEEVRERGVVATSPPAVDPAGEAGVST